MYAGLEGKYNAQDSTQHYSVEQLRQMRSQGINTMFRYLSGGGSWKRLNEQDVANFRAAGMNLTLIHQDRGRSPGDFSREQGREAARAAISRTRALGLPADSAVYFCVDYDASNRDVAGNIVPYFQGIQDELRAQGSPMKVGIYGSGAVCEAVHGAGLAERTWLAGASGWRGSQEFFRSGRWDVVQQIVGNRDLNTINPLTHGLGSVTFNQQASMAEIMGPGAANVDPATASRNLAAWLANPNSPDPEHDATRDQFYQNAQDRLGLNRESVQQILQEGGPFAMILMFFFMLLVGVGKMNDIGTTGQSTRPNEPPPPGTVFNPNYEGESPGIPPSQGILPEIDPTMNLGTQGLGIISALVAQGVKVDLVGANGATAPDGKFDRNDLIAMGERLRQNGTTIPRPEENPIVVLNAYQRQFGQQQQPKTGPSQ